MGLSYTAWKYYAFVIVILLAYYVIPKRFRWTALLGGSIWFYTKLIYRRKQIAIFLCSIAISYLGGLAIQKMRGSKKAVLKKIVLFAFILLSSLPLLLEKIGDFLCGSVLHIARVPWIIPVGLSFYTLQLIAYLTDVYKGKTKAQKNPFKYGLFATFFPQVIQGPIPRYDQLDRQLFEGNSFDFDNIAGGAQLVVWGFFLKYMIADKSAVIVNAVFDNYKAYSGCYIWVAGILYSIQLYTDFLSCTTMSQGVAQMFGIHLGENFWHPYFAVSVKEFWRRWHISLSTWLKDYIYIPLGGNRKGTVCKWLFLLVTFAISGLWHGGRWKFLAWGLLHAFYQIIGEMVQILKRKLSVETAPESRIHRLARQTATCFFVMIAWIIFRADTLKGAAEMIYNMFTGFNPWVLFDDSLLRLGLNWKEIVVLVISIVALWIISIRQEQGMDVRAWIAKRSIVIRWGIYMSAIWIIWIFGSYGFGFDANDFIYGGF